MLRRGSWGTPPKEAEMDKQAERELNAALDVLWDRNLLGNFAQSLGLSGRGTKDELTKKIKAKLLATEKP